MIEQQSLTDIVDDYTMRYAIHKISDSSLPSVYDGMKPSQRMVLWAGYEGGFHPDRPFQGKTLKFIGYATGSFYPYGDQSLSDVLVSLEAPHLRMVRMIEGGGSWSDCGITAADARYTSARLSKAGYAVCDLVSEGAVQMVPNYDGTTTMPLVLPVTFPNILCQPTSGIAVGLATKLPSYNLGELAEVAKVLLKNKGKISYSDLVDLLPGPDMPMGSDVFFDEAELKAIYETGRGKFRQRARVAAMKGGLRFTNFPHNINPEKVASEINKIIDDGSPLIRSVRGGNSSNSGGAFIEVSLKRGANSDAAAELLYSETSLEDPFSVNANVLVGASPITMGVVEMLNHWIQFRFDTVVNISNHRRAKAVERLHIVTGMLKVVVDIDKAIGIVRGSENKAEARTKLMSKFKIDEVQADYVLARTLSSLTKSDSIALEREAEKLKKSITDLDAILASKVKQRNIIIKELDEAVTSFGGPRRSRIVDAATVATKAKALKSAVKSATASGDSAGTGEGFYVTAEGKGKVSSAMPGAHFAPMGTHATVVSSHGQALRLDLSTIPQQGPSAKGVAIMKLKGGDSVTAVGADNVQIKTSQGVGIVAAEDIPVKGRNGGGVRLAAMRKGESIKSITFTSKGATMKRGASVPKS